MGILKALDNVGGIGGFISNNVVSAYYGAKGKAAIVSRDLKSSITEHSRRYDSNNDDDSENKTSERFAKAMGFNTVEECDAFFEEIEAAEKKAKRDAERKKNGSKELTPDEF